MLVRVRSERVLVKGAVAIPSARWEDPFLNELEAEADAIVEVDSEYGDRGPAVGRQAHQDWSVPPEVT